MSVLEKVGVLPPWAGIGRAVDGAGLVNVDSMLSQVGLDWHVGKYPLVANVAGKQIASGKTALIREDTHELLSEVSNDWNPIQNHEAFQFFCDIARAGGMTITTAGTLRGGRLIWALARMDGAVDISPGDPLVPHMLFTNPHQWGKTMQLRFMPIRMINWTTLPMPIGDDRQVFRQSHRLDLGAGAAPKASVVNAAMKQLATDMRHLANIPPNDAVMYFSDIFPVTTATAGQAPKRKKISDRAQQAVALLSDMPYHDPAAGSLLAACSLAHYMVDHTIGRSQDTRLVSAWDGAGVDLKIHALDYAMDTIRFAHA